MVRPDRLDGYHLPNGYYSTQVVELTVPAQHLTRVQTEKVTSLSSLNEAFVLKQMVPNRLVEFQLDDSSWALIVPSNAYTPREHLMAMRFEEGYVPGPEKLSADEGDALFSLMGRIARRMAQDNSVSTVVFGWNWSPRSFGQRGCQSIPTKIHPSIFCLPKEYDTEHLRFIDQESLTSEERRAIRGGRYNILFGSLLTEHVLNGNFQGDTKMRDRLLSMDEAQISERATVVPTKATLEEILTTPGIFSRVFQPMGRFINQTAILLSTTLTDFCPEDADSVIENALYKDATEEYRQSAEAYLTRTPNLLPKDQRERNIEELKEAGYPIPVVESLKKMSAKLSEGGIPFKGWKVGFGCAVAIIYDTESQTGFLSVSAAIANGPGGIFESGLGMRLHRPDEPFSEAEMAIKRETYLSLVDHLVN